MPTTQSREVTVRLHAQQEAFCQSSASYRGFVGGRGSGKSWAGAFDLLCRAQPGHTYLVASPTYTKLEDETLATFTALARQLHLWGGERRSPRPNVFLTTGATVRFRSADEPDKLAGPNLSGVWLDEAGQMTEGVYTTAIGCLREHGEQGWLSATFTPKGRSHWTYRVFGPANPDARLFRARTRDNPFNPPGFAAQLARQYGGEGSLLARQELGGDFVEIEGAEWPSEYFDGPGFWFDDWPQGLTAKVMALDPSKGKDARKGDYAALVALGVDPEGVLYAEADLVRGKSAEWVADWTVAACGRLRPDLLGCEANQWLQLFAVLITQAATRKAVLVPVVELHNKDRKDIRIRRLGTYLGQRRLRFRDTPGTRLLVQQLQEFPEGEFDDGPDAAEMSLRVLEGLLWGRAQEAEGATVILT